MACKYFCHSPNRQCCDLIVRHTEQADDVAASLEDGVLTLDIYLGEPFTGDDETDIPVR